MLQGKKNFYALVPESPDLGDIIFVLDHNQGNKLLLSETPDLTFPPDPPLVSTKGEKVKFERAPKVRSRFKGPCSRRGGTRPRCQWVAAEGSPEGLDGAFVSTAACVCRMGPYGQSVTSNTPCRLRRFKEKSLHGSPGAKFPSRAHLLFETSTSFSFGWVFADKSFSLEKNPSD